MTPAELKVAKRIMRGKLDSGAQEGGGWARAIAEIVELKLALEHAQVCDYPDSVRFRCESCVRANALLLR